jgi:hypothetical protein
MAHGNSVADRYGIEFKGGPARAANGVLDHLCNLVEVNVARHYLAETVRNTDERLVDICIFETAGAKQTTMRCPLKAFLDCITSHKLVSPKSLAKDTQKS